MDIYKDPARWGILFPSGEIIVALFVIAILIILAIIVGILAKRADPLKRPKGLLKVVEWCVEKLDAFVLDVMGPGFENFGGLLLAIIPFLFLSFTIGIMGLPSPINNLAVPLTLALVTFALIHFTAMRYNKIKYFKRFVDPLPVFLPINLLSMWAPLISMTLRMFGNGVVGWVLITIVNNALESLSTAIFGGVIAGGGAGVFLVPIVTPVLHAYFDLFSGFVQTMVFVFLTCLFVAQERPDEIETEVVMASRKEGVK